MNVVVGGYRSWAYTIFKALTKTDSKSWQIQGIITTEDAERNFQNLGISTLVVNPKELDGQETIKRLKAFKPDVFLLYGWSWMVPKELFEKYICLALHPSPLPKYRGGSPLQHQIIQGEDKSAVTIFKIGQGLDAGPIYSQSPFSLAGTIKDIFNRISKVGAEDTIAVLNGIANQTIQPKLQNPSESTFFKRRRKQDSELTPYDFKSKTAKELYNIIRALDDPYPNAYIVCKDGKKLFLKGARIEK